MKLVTYIFTQLLYCLLITNYAKADVPTTLVFKNHMFQFSSTASKEELKQKETAILANFDPLKFMALFEERELQSEKIDFDKVTFEYILIKKAFGAKATEIRRNLENKAQEVEKKYAPQVQAYIDQLVKKQGGKKLRDGKSTIYHLPRGIEFFADFYKFEGQKDILFQAIAESLLANPHRQFINAGLIERMSIRLRKGVKAETRLFTTKDYTEEDMKSLKSFAYGEGYHFERIGDLWIFGGGFGYYITKKIIRDGQALTDPILKASFNRVVKYHVNFGIPVIHSYNQGAAAYYNPTGNEMAFVIPSAGNLNSYTHEITHSRFNRFTKNLEKWITSRSYIIPYQVTGPALSGLGSLFSKFGGLYNLLNEVNSWRTGESFDGKNSDTEIIKKLVSSYGPQAGYEATTVLEKVWTSEKLAGKSVPYLIYHELEAFNRMSLEDILMMGMEGIEYNDFLKKINFLIMYANKKFKDSKLESDAQYLVEEIAKISTEKSILEKLESIDPKYKKTTETDTTKDLSKASLTEVLEEFKLNGSQQSTDLLKGKFLTEIRPSDISAIIYRSVQPPRGFIFHEAVEVLTALLSKVGVTQTIKSESNPIKFRPVIKDSEWLKTLDKALIEHIYEGGIATKKKEIMNWVVENTYPNELPLTYAKTLEILSNTTQYKNSDVWVARLTMMPSGSNRNSLLWGERIVNDLRNKPTTSSGIREAMGWFYRLTLANHLAGRTLIPGGEFITLNKPEKIQLNAKREIKRYSDEDKARLESAVTHLWQLAGDSKEAVRTSAVYAIMSNPVFLIQSEGLMLQALYAKDARYAETIKFLMDAAPEFLQNAKRIYEIQQRKGQSGNYCQRFYR